ncbi:MAG: hypothetical protein ACREO9_03695, partial [Lysobacterales bacterium]
HGRILLGAAQGTAADPITLGQALAGIMQTLLTQALGPNFSVGTAMGPSSPPLNQVDFQDLNTRFQNNEHGSDFILGKKTY